jgi:hypothetical protein
MKKTTNALTAEMANRQAVSLIMTVTKRISPESPEQQLFREGVARDPTVKEQGKTIRDWASKATKALQLPRPFGKLNKRDHELLARFSIFCDQKGRKGIGYKESAIRDAEKPRLRRSTGKVA